MIKNPNQTSAIYMFIYLYLTIIHLIVLEDQKLFSSTSNKSLMGEFL